MTHILTSHVLSAAAVAFSRVRAMVSSRRGRSNRGPNQPLDDRRIFGVNGVQIGVGFPLLKPEFYLPSPFIGPTDHLKGIAWCWQVRQQVTKGLLTAVPADDQPQAQGAPVDLPLHHEFYPLAFGEFGVDGLER